MATEKISIRAQSCLFQFFGGLIWFITFNRLNTARSAITNLFKIFKFQTRKPLVFDAYGELK